MVKVYAVALSVGLVVLIVVIVGSTLAASLGRDDRDPNVRLGPSGRMGLAGLLGFGMGGMAAEFSPIGFEWPVALVVALVAATGSALWARRAAPKT
jgi:hypothetical protein